MENNRISSSWGQSSSSASLSSSASSSASEKKRKQSDQSDSEAEAVENKGGEQDLETGAISMRKVAKRSLDEPVANLHCDSSIFEVAYSEDTIKILDAISSTELWTQNVAEPILRCVFHLETNSVFVVTDGSRLIQLNVTAREENVITADVGILSRHEFVLGVSHDGIHVMTGHRRSRTLELWNVETATNRSVPLNKAYCLQPEFSFDDSYFLFLSDWYVNVWDSHTLSEVASYKLFKEVEYDATFFIDFKMSPTTSLCIILEVEERRGSTLHVRDYLSGEIKFFLAVERNEILGENTMDFCFGPSDSVIIIRDKRHGVGVYCLQTRTVLRRFAVPGVYRTDFNPSRNTIVVRARDVKEKARVVKEIDFESGVVVSSSPETTRYPQIVLPKPNVILL
jgi:hypothetical protein